MGRREPSDIRIAERCVPEPGSRLEIAVVGPVIDSPQNPPDNLADRFHSAIGAVGPPPPRVGAPARPIPRRADQGPDTHPCTKFAPAPHRSSAAEPRALAFAVPAGDLPPPHGAEKRLDLLH